MKKIILIIGILFLSGTVTSISLSEPPNKPVINGPTQVKINVERDWDFMCSGELNIRYQIKWGDNTTELTNKTNGNEWYSVFHTYNQTGTFIIQARTEKGGETSDWREHPVLVAKPRSRPYFNLLFRLKGYD